MASELARYDLYGFDVREHDKRRAESHEDKSTYNIKQFWQRHHEIVNLASQGFKQVEIAEILNITPQTVSNTLNSTLGEEKLSEVRKERDEDAKATIERIRVLRNKALKVYHEIFDGVDADGVPVEGITLKDKIHAADVVTLEMSGMKAPTKIQSTGVVLTGTEILALKERALAEAKNCGLVYNVQAEEVSNESGDGQ